MEIQPKPNQDIVDCYKDHGSFSQHLNNPVYHSQKMEIVGRLAAGIAHDFNSLLAVIVGNVDLLLSSLGENDPSRDNLLEIEYAANLASELSRQLLTFSRSQGLQPEILDLNLILAGLDNTLRRIMGAKTQVVVVKDPSLGLVKAVPGQLEQLLLNLAINARDAMPQGGKFLIQTTNIEVLREYDTQKLSVPSGSYIKLSVSDTGCGMEKDILGCIFEPFFTTKAPWQGSGLGLATVYSIVKQNGGDIRVYSEVGIGTLFNIYLPRLSKAGAEVPLTSTE